MSALDSHDTIWSLEPHTRAKHELLRHYLNAWFPIMARNNSRLIVLDGFAGPGVYSGGEPGSPAIALETLLDHSAFTSMSDAEHIFVFNEQDTARHSSLEAVVGRLRDLRGGFPTCVRVGTFNHNFRELASTILERLEGRRLAPTFAFIDPFGYRDIPMQTISDLLAFDKCELFVYFDFNSVNRFGTAGNVDERLEELFGTDEFKHAPLAGDSTRKEFFHDLYRRQLQNVAGFNHVQSFEMVNDQGRTGHYLYFCTRHLLGFDRMKQAMWKVAPAGNFRFSDRDVQQHIQDPLFEPTIDTTPLRDALAGRFAGREVAMREIESFTIAETEFTSSHIKTLTLKPMQDDGVIEVSNQKRRGTFPDRVKIRFPSG